jgi:hypothetical protein
MQKDGKKLVGQQPPNDEMVRRPVQAGAQSDNEPFEIKNLRALRRASEDLKEKIAGAKRRNDLPVDSKLGNPDWEQSVADGRLDIPDEHEDQ